MDQVSRKGKKANISKNTRSEITQVEFELGKRPFNDEQRRPLNGYYRHHKLKQENDNMRGIQFRQTGHETPHAQVRRLFFFDKFHFGKYFEKRSRNWSNVTQWLNYDK